MTPWFNFDPLCSPQLYTHAHFNTLYLGSEALLPTVQVCSLWAFPTDNCFTASCQTVSLWWLLVFLAPLHFIEVTWMFPDPRKRFGRASVITTEGNDDPAYKNIIQAAINPFKAS